MNKKGIVWEYREWILLHKDASYTVKEDTENKDRIMIDTVYALGEVLIHEMDRFIITELRITNRKNDQCCFYLHFELQDLKHAEELFDEMLTVLIGLKDRQRSKIIICCSSALTSSYFAEKIKEACALMNLDYEFEAVSYDRLLTERFPCDLVMLAPQVSFMYSKLKKALKDIKLVNIPTNIFARYDSQGMIELVTLCSKN